MNIRTHGIILSGGKGQRMTGLDKGLVLYKHRPLVQHVIARLKPQVHSLVISANRNLEDYKNTQQAVVADCIEGFGGPLVGLLSAMNYLSDQFNNNPTLSPTNMEYQTNWHEWVVICPCDAPHLPKNLVARLSAELAKSTQGVQCLMPFDGIRNQPLFSMLALSTLPLLTAKIDEGERKAERWLLSLNSSIVDFSANPDSFSNINTMKDMHSIQ
jgi:molybdopterin-guanine dinucleotide biosynthesis protein A